jgi:hypothetical protein
MRINGEVPVNHAFFSARFRAIFINSSSLSTISPPHQVATTEQNRLLVKKLSSVIRGAKIAVTPA